MSAGVTSQSKHSHFRMTVHSAWDISEMRKSMDYFELTPEQVRELEAQEKEVKPVDTPKAPTSEVSAEAPAPKKRGRPRKVTA